MNAQSVQYKMSAFLSSKSKEQRPSTSTEIKAAAEANLRIRQQLIELEAGLRATANLLASLLQAPNKIEDSLDPTRVETQLKTEQQRYRIAIEDTRALLRDINESIADMEVAKI